MLKQLRPPFAIQQGLFNSFDKEEIRLEELKFKEKDKTIPCKTGSTKFIDRNSFIRVNYERLHEKNQQNHELYAKEVKELISEQSRILRDLKEMKRDKQLMFL